MKQKKEHMKLKIIIYDCYAYFNIILIKKNILLFIEL